MFSFSVALSLVQNLGRLINDFFQVYGLICKAFCVVFFFQEENLAGLHFKERNFFSEVICNLQSQQQCFSCFLNETKTFFLNKRFV